MDFITIVSPDNIEIEYRLAGVGSRLAAVAVDLIIQTLAFVVFIVILLFGIYKLDFSALEDFNPSGWLTATTLIVAFMIYFGYFVICELVTNGQSIGKRIFGLRVIRGNGQPIGLGQSLIRNLFRYFIDAYGPGVLCIFFSKKCRRVGDMAASTIVVSENPKGIKPHELTLLNLKADIRTDRLDNLSLSGEEAFWLSEYFGRKDTFPNASQGHLENLIEYFADKFGVPREKLDEEILLKILRANNK